MNNFPSFKHRNALLPLYTHRHTHTRPHIRNFSVDIFVVNTPVYLSSSAISRYFFSFRVTRHIKPLQLTALKRLAVTDKHWDYLPLGCSYSHNTGSVVSCVREERSPNSAGQRILFLLIEASSSDEGRVIRRCNVNLWINYIRACLSKIVGFCFVYAHKQYQVYTYTQTTTHTRTYNHIDKAQIATHTQPFKQTTHTMFCWQLVRKSIQSVHTWIQEPSGWMRVVVMASRDASRYKSVIFGSSECRGDRLILRSLLRPQRPGRTFISWYDILSYRSPPGRF